MNIKKIIWRKNPKIYKNKYWIMNKVNGQEIRPKNESSMRDYEDEKNKF